MSRTISWIVAWLAIAIAFVLSYQETIKYSRGPDPESGAVDVQQSDILLRQEFDGEDLLTKAGEDQEGRRYLVEHLSKKLIMPMTAISVGSAVGDTKARMRITCTEAQRKEIGDRLDDLQFPLRLLEIVDITLQKPDGEILEVYTVGPDTLGYPIGRELLFLEMLQGVCKPVADAVGRTCVDHLNKCIKKNALDPALVAYRFVFARELGADTSLDCAMLDGIEKNTTDEERSDLARRLKQAAGCTGSGVTARNSEGKVEENLDADQLAKYIRDHICPDIARSFLIKSVYEKSNQPDKAQAALNELPDHRSKIYKSMAADFVACAVAGLLLIACVFQKRKLHTLPAVDETQVMCTEPYGWLKLFLIGVFTCICIAFGFVIMYVTMPEQMAETSALLTAYFEPVKTALGANIEESILVGPVIIGAFVLAGRKHKFTDFVKFRLKTDRYNTSALVRIGLQCLAMTWAPAMVATLLSYWFHYPWEKASTVQTELLIASGSVPAILVLLIGYVFVAPILEEVAFRGVVHPALRRKFATWPSIIIGAAFFAIVHLEFAPWWIVDKFIFAAVNAYALEKTGSIVPGIVNHMLTNLLVMTFMVGALM